MNEKFNELMKDEAFVEKLFALENDTEVRDLLAANGVDLTLAEIAAIKTGLDSNLSENGELSEDDLGNVAGGYADAIRAAADFIVTLGDGVHNWTKRRW